MQQHINRVNEEENKPKKKISKKHFLLKNVNMQGLFSFDNERNQLFHTATRVDKLCESADKMIEVLTPQIQTMIAGFSNAVEDTKKTFIGTVNVLDVCSDIISSLLQISFAKPGFKLASLAVETFRTIKKYIGRVNFNLEKVKELLSMVPQQITDFVNKTVKMQIDVNDIMMNVVLQPSAIVSSIFVVLSVIFTNTLPSKTGMEAMLKRLGEMGRAAKGINDLNNVLHEQIMNMLEFFGVETLGLKKEKELVAAVEGYSKWCDDVQALVGHKLRGDGTCDSASIVEEIMRDTKKISHVEQLYKKGMLISQQIGELKLHSKITLSFNIHMRYLSEVYKSVDTSGAFGNKPRTQPVVIWLFGESGVGKSGMSWPLAVDLNNSLVNSVEEARNFSKNIYMRNVEQEFWDNYQGQNVVIYDDFGQMRDSSSNPNMEFMELIRTANIAPYPLHMAHLEDKRKAKFTSKVILMTSNVFEQSVNSLTFPDAFRRRVDLCAEVRNKDEYTKEGWSQLKGMAVRRLDRSKVQKITGELVSTCPYLIDLVNPETGDKYQTDIEYEQFLDMCLAKTKQCRDESAGMNRFLMEYAEKRIDRCEKVEVEEYFYEASMEQPLDPIEKKEVKIQGVIPDNLVTISKEQFEFILAQGKEQLYDQYGKACDMTKLAYDYALNEHFSGNIYRKVERGISNLQKIFIKSMDSAKEWLKEQIEIVQNHQWTYTEMILGSLLGLLTIVGFWKWICSGNSKEQKYTKRNFINTGAVLIIKSRDDKQQFDEAETFDARNMSSQQVEMNLLRYLDVRHRVIKLGRVTNSIINLVHNHAMITDKMVLVVDDPIVKYSGRFCRLVDSECNEWMESKEIVAEAAVSGDAKTLALQKKIVVEAKTSGDCVTKKPETKRVLEAYVSSDSVTKALTKQKIVEAKVSGDEVTQKSKVVRVVEAFASADAKTLAKPAKKMIEMKDLETVDAEMQMWKDQVAQRLITNRILTNLYKVCTVEKNGKVLPLLNGLFVRSNIMLVPGHLIGFLDWFDTLEIRNLFDVSFRVPFKDVRVIPVTNALGESKEAALLVFPKYVCQHSDIVKHFQNAESMQKFKRCEVTLPVLRYSDKLKALMSTLIECDKVEAYDKPCYLCDKEKGNYILRQGLEYKMPTMNGDCGAPLIINETQVLRKIAGIHVAGDATGSAYAESITQKDLERSFKLIEADMQISVDLDNMLDFSKPVKEIPTGEEFGPECLIEECDVPATKLIPVGRIPDLLYEPGKTEITPSLVHGKIDVIKTKPAYLTNVKVDGKFVNMKHRNLMKCAMDTPYIDKDLIDQAYLLTKKVWLSNARDELKKVLTYEEAIRGNDVSEYITSINRSSSPGYPWIKDKTKGTKGKQSWFGCEGEFELNKEVEEAVNNRIENAKKGRRLPVLWVDTLKDERRPIEKVNQLKTRVFSNGPMDFSIAFRMYYLGFIAHLMENRITNEVSIGTNVYSQDWSKTVRKLSKFGKKVIAGDFSTFDGSLNVCIMEKFAEMANEFYDDSDEDQLVRKVLLMDVYNSIHICNDSVYMTTHSQPSGNPATTPLNCFINSMGLRMCFDICAREAQVKMTMMDFAKHVSMVSYGDDNVINFSDEVSEWYNMETIAKAFATLGFTYTDELKGANGEVPKWRSIQDVQYLKRKFRYDTERKVWEAPLCMDTILEMPNWCRGKLDIEEGTKLNCENAIMELSMHEKEVFDKWSNVISKAFKKATNNELDINTYRGYCQERFFQYYM